jgi:cyclopropane fatty-acyl-phospholipid synthase-like methyltransferase
MSDFRVELYERYVSSFKGKQSQQDEAQLARYWAWCHHKYLPIIGSIPRQAAVLDLGCGAGQMLEFLKNEGFNNARGVDISQEQVDIARGRGLNAEVGDAIAFLKAHENSFDLLIAFDFFEHFTKAELLELTGLILNTLKPGGYLLLQTPNGEGLFPGQIVYGDLTHMTIFTPGAMTNLLRLSNFEQIAFYESGPAPIDTKGQIRLILWRIIRGMANAARVIETGKTQQIWTENLICCCRKGAS